MRPHIFVLLSYFSSILCSPPPPFSLFLSPFSPLWSYLKICLWVEVSALVVKNKKLKKKKTKQANPTVRCEIFFVETPLCHICISYRMKMTGWHYVSIWFYYWIYKCWIKPTLVSGVSVEIGRDSWANFFEKEVWAAERKFEPRAWTMLAMKKSSWSGQHKVQCLGDGPWMVIVTHGISKPTPRTESLRTRLDLMPRYPTCSCDFRAASPTSWGRLPLFPVFSTFIFLWLFPFMIK